MRKCFRAQFHSFEYGLTLLISVLENLTTNLFADVSHENNDKWRTEVVNNRVVNLQVD